MSSARLVCGIDFDNTIATYDELLGKIARERGLIEANGVQSKRTLRDQIRRLPDGEIEWQKCQALLYGPRISEAGLARGFASFLAACRERAIPVRIVSHKTEFSNFDPGRTNLRSAALDWMRTQRFFDQDGFGLNPECVFFAATRQEKIDRIRSLACTHFIDDLEETFLEETFPVDTVRLLYEPGRQAPPPPGVALMRTWQEICDYFFSAN